MNVSQTINTRTGGVRYYVDGRRVSREHANEIKRAHKLDTFATQVRGHIVRHSCEAREGAQQ